ncbi:12079_t:CDS:2 [Gigaspora margarita]|uniref:12079_t:CDS:1 n=1 Tax=Gigaspora margarita TaxID=4874 RepID=A0ABN7W2P3_GIGMA|nr:12079_t:CDS:2 [Gigaspora margarita]
MTVSLVPAPDIWCSFEEAGSCWSILIVLGSENFSQKERKYI